MPIKKLSRTIITSMIGTIFEFYDFALFGYFAPILGELFFPAENKTVQLISVFAVFAIGFVVRPVGGLFFGHMGDVVGRKKALVWSILLMAIPTFLIGLLPTYAKIGLWAPVLLIIMRMLQGLSFGGNYSGSLTFVIEHTPVERRGFVGGLSVTSCLAGFLLGSATAALFSIIYTQEQMHSFGWRIPFLFGVLICGVGFYMRQKLEETPEFIKEEKDPDHQNVHPLTEIAQTYKRQILYVVGTTMLHDLSFYLIFSYMTTYLTAVLNLSDSMSFAINTGNLVFAGIVTIIAGWMSDRYGRKKILTLSALIFVVGTIPLFMLINTKNPMLVLVGQLILAIGVGSVLGPLPSFMMEAFPTRVRCSASSVVTNLSGPIFGGVTPMFVTWMIAKTGSNLMPAFYLTLIAGLAIVAIRRVKVLGKS